MADFIQVVPVIDYDTRKLCVKPYYNHKHGCPNFNKRQDCPPFAPLFDCYFDISKPVYAIYHAFDIKAHSDRMQQKHPDWTDKQINCVLYWQGSARKQLTSKINCFLMEYPEYEANITPEAMGVDMIKTMASVGITICFPPVDIVYKIALAGIKNRQDSVVLEKV